MNILEQVISQELNGIILRAFEAASDETERIVEIERLQVYLNNELVDTVAADVLDFFDDFGYDIESEEITPEMLEISGVTIPTLTVATVRKVFTLENICFTEDGFICNDPQTSCLRKADGEYDKEDRRYNVNL